MNLIIFGIIIVIIIFISIYIGLSLEKYVIKYMPFEHQKNDNLFDIPCTKKEPFIVADANDTANYEKLKDSAINENDPINNVSTNDISNNIKKSNSKEYISSLDFGMQFPDDIMACANTSINYKFIAKGTKLLPNQISCDKPNKIQAEEYYRTKYNKEVIPLEDRITRGYNYDQYSNSPSPYAIDDLILTRATKGVNDVDKNIPNGFNFAFHNTPAMRML